MKTEDFIKRQGTIADLPARSVPDKPLRARRVQDESMTPLERASVQDGQRELIGGVVVFDWGKV